MTLNTKELAKLAVRLEHEGRSENAAELNDMIKQLAEPVEMGIAPDVSEEGPVEMGSEELLSELDSIKIEIATDKDAPGLKEKVQNLISQLEEFVGDLVGGPPSGAVPVGAVASKIISLTDALDSCGWDKEASTLDGMLQKMAVTMVEDPDEEFKKKLQEEGYSPDTKVYVGKPDEQIGEGDIVMPGKEVDGPSLDSGIESKLVELASQGWDIFGPGDLNKWLDIKGYKKMSDMPEEEVAKIQEEMDKGASVKRADVDSDLPGVMDLESEDRVQPEQEAGNLPEHQPGALDLDSPHRINPEEIKQELDLFLTNPEEAAGENLLSKIQQLINEQVVELPGGTDEEAVNSLEQVEKAKGVTWSTRKEVFTKLADLADRLDDIGATDEANLVDQFIEVHATDLEYKGEADTEQSKRYDDKHHHSLQVREPKTKQERVDREGRDKHHVHTYENQERDTQHYNKGKENKKEASLSTRYCPEHIGVSMGRVGENTYQCPLCREVYNWETGWSDHDGKEHPGGSVAAQTPDSSGYDIPHRIFDSRENISNRVN